MLLRPGKRNQWSASDGRAHASARLAHRAIVRSFDLLELDAEGNTTSPEKVVALAIIMELLEGETLGSQLSRERELSLDDALDIFMPTLVGLAHADRADIVHRDIKPDNIFLARDPDGIDTEIFISVCPTSMSVVEMPLTLDLANLGTPAFMSPEQAKGGA